MRYSIFLDKKSRPEDVELQSVLGSTVKLWNEIREYLNDSCSDITEEWKYYGKTSGWTFLGKSKKRTIYYLFPNNGYFIILFVYGEKAILKAYDSELSQSILDKIKNSEPFMEGRSFPVEVKAKEDVASVKKLIDIKINS